MALPKKKTSKARSRRRFSQYETKRTEKLIRVSNTLKQIDRPFIFDRKATTVVAKKSDKIETSPKKEAKKENLKIEKVDKIEVEEIKTPKKTKNNEATKKDVEKTTEDNKSEVKKDEKGQWFKNLFNIKKGSSGNQVKDLSQKGQKKVFRRKAM